MHSTPYISPQNILMAFWAMECRLPETINPISSKFFMVLEAFAAFQRLVPHIPDVCILHIQKIYLWILGLKQNVFVSIICMYQVYVVELLLCCLYCILMH